MAERAAEMAEDALLERGVVLRAAEQIGEKLAEYGVALQELHHARGDGAAQERAAIEAADDARGEFQFRGEGGFDARGIFFGAAFGEGLAQELAGAHGVEKAFASEGIDPGGGVADERPVPADDAAIRERAHLGRGQDVAVELGGFGGEFLGGRKSMEMRAQFAAGMRAHAAANAKREMVGAGKGPDVALEIGEKLDDDFLGGLRDEVALGHFELIAVQGARAGEKLIARACGEDQEIGGAPLAINGVARLVRGSIHFVDAGAVNLATGLASAIEKQAIQDGARIDDDGMLEVELGAMIFGADDFDVVNKLFWTRIIQ